MPAPMIASRFRPRSLMKHCVPHEVSESREWVESFHQKPHECLRQFAWKCRTNSKNRVHSPAAMDEKEVQNVLENLLAV